MVLPNSYRLPCEILEQLIPEYDLKRYKIAETNLHSLCQNFNKQIFGKYTAIKTIFPSHASTHAQLPAQRRSLRGSPRGRLLQLRNILTQDWPTGSPYGGRLAVPTEEGLSSSDRAGGGGWRSASSTKGSDCFNTESTWRLSNLNISCMFSLLSCTGSWRAQFFCSLSFKMRRKNWWVFEKQSFQCMIHAVF